MHHLYRTLASLGAFFVVAAPATASAHLDLTDPPSRYAHRNIKYPPCGDGGDIRSSNVVTYTAGQTITLEWKEYIDHPSHFRVAFDPDGTDDFQAPNCTSGCSTRNPSFEFDVNDAVLVDDISDKTGGTYTKTIQLPDVTCDKCVLQVIQVMYDKPPIEIPGNDIYYQCADLKLVAPAAGDAGADADTANANADTTDSAPDSGAPDTMGHHHHPSDTDSNASDSSDSGTPDPSISRSQNSDAGCTIAPSGDPSRPLGLFLVVGLGTLLCGPAANRPSARR